MRSTTSSRRKREPAVALAAAVLLSWLCTALPNARASGVLTVSTNSDAVNGDTSSPEALRTNPGPDGISLREAIAAANNAPGSDPITVVFSSSLAGQTITLTAGFDIRRNGVAVHGLLDQGQPAVTLDTNVGPPFVFNVLASDVALTGLRLVNLHGWGMNVSAGAAFGQPGPQLVHDVRLQDNIFLGTSAPLGNAIGLGMLDDSNGAELRDITISNNTFLDLVGDRNGILAYAGGVDDLIDGVVIRDNTFSDVTFPVEFVPASGTNCAIVGSRVVGNTFDLSLQPINLNQIGRSDRAATGNMIDDTLISQNVFRNNRGPDVVLLGGMNNASNNTITNTRIVDDVFLGSSQYGGVAAVGGRAGGAFNHIDSVEVRDDTFVRNSGGGVNVNPNIETSGNVVTNVRVVDSIFWENDTDFNGVDSAHVSFSLTSQFANSGGDVFGNPKFADDSGGEFHLTEGSAAIDSGTSDGATTTDLDDRLRFDDPSTPNTGTGAIPYVDMGAYEFEGIVRPALHATITAIDGGTGIVTSAPPGLDCPVQCSSGFDPGTAVTLTANAATGSRFAGWSGACSGTTG